MHKRAFFITWTAITALLAGLFKIAYAETSVTDVSAVIAVLAFLLTLLINYVFKHFNLDQTKDDNHEN